MTLRLRLVQKIYSISIEIAQLRKDLFIDENSILFKVKNAFKFTKKGIHKSHDFNKMSLIELKNILLGLLRYYAKLSRVRRFFNPLLFTISTVASLYFYLLSIISSHTKKYTVSEQLLIVFGVIPYDFRRQRPQQLLSIIKDKFFGQIVYIDPLFLFNTISLLNTYNIQNRDGVFIAKIGTSKSYNIQLQKMTSSDELKTVKALKSIITKTNAKKILLKIDHPFWSFILNYFNYPSVYDCIDDHSSFDVGSKQLVIMESILIKKSNVVIVTSEYLYKQVTKARKHNVFIIRNGCEFDHFNSFRNKKIRKPPDLMDIGKPIIGYYGAIAEWFDQKLVTNYAKTHPKHNIVLIGEITHPTIKKAVKSFSNIFLLGEKKYADLPKYLAFFDVCLIPFLINSVIKATNPVKIYEYLATGKAVVTTNIPELKPIRKLVYLSRNLKEFSSNVEAALRKNNPKLNKQRILYAKKNTWDKRGVELLKILSALL